MKSTTFKILILFTAIAFFACDSKEKASEEDQTLTVEEDTASLEVTENAGNLEEEDLLISAQLNNQLQIALGEISAEKASSPKVKEFGQMIAEENKQLQDNITELAAASGVQIDSALTPEYVGLLDTIQSYSGQKFDSAFLEIVIQEHEDDIERYTKLASASENPMVREVVSSTLEILQRHQQQAENVQDALKDK